MMFQPKQNNSNIKTLRSCIAPGHTIDSDIGVLSLVRRFDRNEHHAFLVLETVNDHNERVIWEAHFVINQETENTGNPKGLVLYREIDMERLRDLSENCHAVVWDVTREEINQFHERVQSEQARAERGEINYLLSGNAPTTGFFGASLETSQSQALRDWSIDNSRNSVSQHALRTGHNCYSWAKDEIVRPLNLPMPTQWTQIVASAFVSDPRQNIQGITEGRVNNTQPEPKPCSIM